MYLREKDQNFKTSLGSSVLLSCWYLEWIVLFFTCHLNEFVYVQNSKPIFLCNGVTSDGHFEYSGGNTGERGLGSLRNSINRKYETDFEKKGVMQHGTLFCWNLGGHTSQWNFPRIRIAKKLVRIVASSI